jgi:hypothetical protein
MELEGVFLVSGINESHQHNVTISIESPNYSM